MGAVATAHADGPPADTAALICSYDWDCSTALAIVWRESRFEPEAVNPASGCAGLFQINPIHGYSREWLLVPENNVTVAYALYEERGWQPWGY